MDAELIMITCGQSKVPQEEFIKPLMSFLDILLIILSLQIWDQQCTYLSLFLNYEPHEARNLGWLISLYLCLRPHSISPLNQSASMVTQNLEATLANSTTPFQEGA